MSVTEASISGESIFDLDLGMFVNTTQTMDIKLSMTIPLPSPAAKGANPPAAPKTQTLQSDVHEVSTTTFELK